MMPRGTTAGEGLVSMSWAMPRCDAPFGADACAADVADAVLSLGPQRSAVRRAGRATKPAPPPPVEKRYER